MHFLFITPSYQPFVGGVQTFQRTMAQRLVADGHQVTILTTNARHADDFWLPPNITAIPLPQQEVLDGVVIERLTLAYPRPSPYAFGLLRRAGHWLHRSGLSARIQRPLLLWLARWMPPLSGLREALERLVPQADLIQAVDSSWDGLFVAAMDTTRRCRKPFIAIPFMHLGNNSVIAHFQMAHQVDVYRNAAAILALSRQEAGAFVGLGVLPSRIHIIRMGINATLPNSFQDLDGTEFRYRHGLTSKIVAFLGANTYDKGTFTLVQAIARLNLAGLEVELVCAGPQSGKLAAFLRRQPEEIQAFLCGRMHLLGVVDEQTKQQLLAACDLLALPSQVDTFGIVLLEAWLHAKPVIGAKAGGIPDLVQSEKTGLLVPFGDVTALTAAIHRLLTEPKLAAQLGAAGRQQVLRRYTWDQTYHTLVGIYEQVLAAV